MAFEMTTMPSGYSLDALSIPGHYFVPDAPDGHGGAGAYFVTVMAHPVNGVAFTCQIAVYTDDGSLATRLNVGGTWDVWVTGGTGGLPAGAGAYWALPYSYHVLDHTVVYQPDLSPLEPASVFWLTTDGTGSTHQLELLSGAFMQRAALVFGVETAAGDSIQIVTTGAGIKTAAGVTVTSVVLNAQEDYVCLEYSWGNGYWKIVDQGPGTTVNT